MKDFKLDSHAKINSGFKTPDHYFDDFSEKLMQQLPENETKVISIFAKRKTWLFAAAAVLALALSIPIMNQNKNQSYELDAVTIENYLAINAGVSDTELIDLLQEEDIKKIELNHTIDDQTIEDLLVTNSNFEEYIID